MTLCWASEVVIYACIPDEVPEYATMCVTSLAGTALMLVPFWRRVAAGLRAGGKRLFLAGLVLALLNVVYSLHFIAGLRVFETAESVFVNCLAMVVMPIVLLAMRRRVAPETWLSVALVGVGIVLALLRPSTRSRRRACA